MNQRQLPSNHALKLTMHLTAERIVRLAARTKKDIPHSEKGDIPHLPGSLGKLRATATRFPAGVRRSHDDGQAENGSLQTPKSSCPLTSKDAASRELATGVARISRIFVVPWGKGSGKGSGTNGIKSVLN
jgi:hypothetical protein